MAELAAVILTKNEEENIAECIESVAWADEVIVLDSESTDRTVEIAWEKGARVFTHPFRNYAEQRNVALSLAETEWVFFVDADERATPELGAEIREATEREEFAGWWVPRRNYIVGKWIQHGGWYPDYQLRLLRREKARYDPLREVHEVVLLEGEAGYLENPLIHYNYRSWGEFVARQRRYARFEARVLLQQGIRPKPWTYFTQPWREFRRRYITFEGYKDGLHGLILASLMAYYTWLVYTRLHKMAQDLA